jgi:hypothetical protein
LRSLSYEGKPVRKGEWLHLTFNLAPGGGTVPSGSDFAIWFENTVYEPFASSVQYSPGRFESGSPVQKNLTNISASGGVAWGDGSPWAARALWNYSALETFVALPGVKDAGWLRAIEGSWKGLPTLTVEGKLSWGANPLAASTPNDGIPDGERVNPLYDVGLEFHSVDANQSSLATGTGYAVWIGESYQSDSGAERQVSNYSSQGLVGNATVPTVSNYVTTLPVTQTQGTQTVSLEVVANESSGLTAVPINGSHTEVSVNYDLVKSGPVKVRVSGSGSGGRSTLYGVFQEVVMGAKAPTWLWVPTDNGTVNGLPVGLQRYAGEQSFDLVVVNASASVSSDPIPLPWGGTASGITLSAGLNDFLIPREQFLYSPFGQAILLGKNTTFNAYRSLPLVGSSEQGYITDFDGANFMVDLGAYWQNRVINSGPGNITGSTESGTPEYLNDNLSQPNPLTIQVMAAASATSANTGGLPSVPSLYSTVGNPSALQSIVTLNITSSDTFDLLLAALIDNTTGGANAVNGTLESVTYQVGFLGLNAAVVNAISNATEPSDGLYGAPASNFPPPPAPSGWGAFWNAVTSFVTNPLGTVLSLVSVVWNAATAAFTYLDHLAHEAAAISAEVLARTAAAIVHVGQIIANALQELLSYMYTLVKNALASVINPIKDAAGGYVSSLGTTFNATVQDVVNGGGDNGAVSESDAAHFLSALSGEVLVLSLAVGVATTVIFTLLTEFDLGASFMMGIFMTILTVGSLFAFSGLVAAAALTAAATWEIDNFVNRTLSANEQTLSQVNWKAFAESLGFAGSITDTPLAIYLGVQEAEADNPLLLPGLAMTFDMVALIILGIAWVHSTGATVIIATIVSAVGLLLSTLAANQARVEGGLGLLSFVDLGLGATGLGASLYDLKATY